MLVSVAWGGSKEARSNAARSLTNMAMNNDNTIGEIGLTLGERVNKVAAVATL